MDSKMVKVRWPEEDEQKLKDIYSDLRNSEIAEILNRSQNNIANKAHVLKLKKSKEFLSKIGKESSSNPRSKASQFKKGITPWNTGLKGINFGGKLTQFKKNHVPKNYRKVGSIRIGGEGYLEIKVAEGMRQWRLLYRENWKEAHGSYPDKEMILIFKDGDRKNCDPDNLDLISRKELMLKNSIHNYPQELREIMQLTGVLNRKINQRKDK